MRKNLKQIANVLMLFLALSLFFSYGMGTGKKLLALDVWQGIQQPAASDPTSDQAAPSLTPDPAVDSSQQLLSDQMLKRQQFLQDIKDQLKSAQSDYFSINNNVKDTQNKLIDVQETKTTLQIQLSILNQQMENTVEITKNVLMQIQEKENQIALLQDDIKIKDVEIGNQKKMLSDYLKVLYEDENAMNNTTDKEQAVNIVKMLLSDKSPDEALRELHYFNILEATGRAIFDKLEKLVNEQETEQITLENSRNRLEMLYRQLEEQQQTLQTQQQAKAQLLDETKGQENIYQQLLDESQQEEAQALEDIKSLSDNLKFIQDKIAELGDKFNPDDYKSVFDPQTTNVYQYMKDHPDGGFVPRWPVSPSRGISAYFHDPAYRASMGMEHQAIDIRALQGTPIHAPADGVVYKTRDNGYGYSYIILAHSGGFMTLYGHVSEIRVKEGEKIVQGQVIGLSGATPGTKGAGLMTTGPHLHFEVMKGGKHVDPLDYLPLSYLPLDSLPQKYLSRITGEPLKVSRTVTSDGLPADSGVAGDTGYVSDSQQFVKMAEQSGNAEINGGNYFSDGVSGSGN